MFRSCLIVINPSATQQHRAADYRDQLTIIFGGNVKEHKLNKSDFENQDAITNLLNGMTVDDLIAVCGGDGTVNLVVNTMLRIGSKAIVLPLWCGNANDIAHMLNGRVSHDLKALLKTAKPTSAYALSVTIESEIKFALAYVSFGATALIMKSLEDKLNHNNFGAMRRLLSEASRGLYVMTIAQRQSVKINHQTTKLYELAYLNGSKIAKLYPAPSKLSEPWFTRIQLKHKYPLFINFIVRLIYGHLWKRQTTITQWVIYESPVTIQIDGEVRVLQAATMVKIEQYQLSYNVLSTRL